MMPCRSFTQDHCSSVMQDPTDSAGSPSTSSARPATDTKATDLEVGHNLSCGNGSAIICEGLTFLSRSSQARRAQGVIQLERLSQAEIRRTQRMTRTRLSEKVRACTVCTTCRVPDAHQQKNLPPAAYPRCPWQAGIVFREGSCLSQIRFSVTFSSLTSGPQGRSYDAQDSIGQPLLRLHVQRRHRSEAWR